MAAYNANQHKRRGLAVLLTDLYDPAGLERGINVLRYAKFEPFVLHVVDPFFAFRLRWGPSVLLVADGEK